MANKDAFDETGKPRPAAADQQRPPPYNQEAVSSYSNHHLHQQQRNINIATITSPRHLHKLGSGEKDDLDAEEQQSNDFSEKESGTSRELEEHALLYGLEDIPPFCISFLLGLQHTFQFVTSCVAIPFILCTAMCMESDSPDKALIVSTLIFVSGLITIMQTTVGSTLPIVQGSTVSHLVPALAIMNLPKWQCPANLGQMGEDEKREEWQKRMREVQGAVIFASMFEMLLAITGCIGYLTKYITPLTVAPAITLIGLSLFRNAVEECSKNYYVAGSMVFLLIIFSQHLRNVKLSLPWRKETKFPIFQVFPVLLAIIIVWTACGILTVLDILPEGNLARIDSKKRIIEESSWFRIPYPFQFGWPSVSIGAVLGMLCGVITSTIESIGDYYCCASILRAPAPPEHAMNRGIFVEGFGCVLSGIMGTGNASTSFSDNIGMLGVTKVGSRRVIQIAGCIMLVMGLVGKAAAVFISLPDPILGGMFLFLFSLVMSVGIGTLKDVNLESSRNIFIISFSIFVGLAVSQWMNSKAVMLDTGIGELDTLLQVLLSTGMFVAGMTAFVLDNTISGTDEERGLTRRRGNKMDELSLQRDTTYDLPFGMESIKKCRFLRWIPISPTYEKHPISLLACNRSESLAPLNDPTTLSNRISTTNGTDRNHVPV